MKRMSSLLFVFIAATTLAYAQADKPVRPAKEEQQFKGYTIRLLPSTHGTYGYDILKGKTMVLHQTRNPFNGSPAGLSNKEDVYKVAKWQIENSIGQKAQGNVRFKNSQAKLPPVLQERTNKMPARVHYMGHRVPLRVAEELHITVGNEFIVHH